MGHAWSLGIKLGDIGNVPRYIFFAVQNILILAAICASFVAPFDPVAYNSLRIGALFVAFTVNVVERYTFWLYHAHSNYKDCILWNLCADFIRLLVTEPFIYFSLVIALYTTSPFYSNGQLPRGDYLKNGYTVVGLIAFLYVLTVLAMKTILLLILTRSIVKQRVVRDPNVATFQRRLLFSLCGNICIWPWVKVVIVFLIWICLQSPRSSFLFLPAVLFNIIPMGLWLLYILGTFPFFSASMFDGPHKCNRHLQDARVFSSLYQQMHNLVTVNTLRPTRSVFVVPIFLFFVTIISNIYVRLYLDFH